MEIREDEAVVEVLRGGIDAAAAFQYFSEAKDAAEVLRVEEEG